MEEAMNAVTTPDPITPPPELFVEWLASARRVYPNESVGLVAGEVARFAYRAGADMELEACIKWLLDSQLLSGDGLAIQQLRDSRRPKPPSLKAQAFAALRNSPVDPVDETLQLSADAELVIRQALSLLNDDN